MTAKPRAASRAKKPRRRPAKRKPVESPGTLTLVTHLFEGTDDEIRAECAKHVDGWDRFSEQDRADCVRLMRLYGKPTAPRFEGTPEDNKQLGVPEGVNKELYAFRLLEAMGSSSGEYASERLSDLTNYYHKQDSKGATAQRMSSAIAFAHGAKPADPVQGSLLIQMAATHDAALRALANVGQAPFAEQYNCFGNLATKLLNVYARQAEVLAKLQRGGEQVVKHIHVDNRFGGQALVAETFVKGGVGEESRDRPHEQSALSPAMLGHDPQGNGVPIAGDAGPEEVQAPRRRAGKRRPAGK